MNKMIIIVLAISMLSACARDNYSQSAHSHSSNLSVPSNSSALLATFLRTANLNTAREKQVREFYQKILDEQDVKKPLRLIRYHMKQRYLGQTFNAHKSGLGIMHWPNGSLYLGQWRYDRRNGEGYLVSLDDNRQVINIYEGEWLDDKASGEGRLEMENGNYYQGEFVDNKKHGIGSFTWVSGDSAGDSYEGVYQENLRVGPGTYTWADGSKHTGSWINGVREGESTTLWANGQSYQGMYTQGKRTGQGVKEWPNGVRYEGQFKDGLAHGRGVKSNSKGESCLGDWEFDELVGNCLSGEKI